jgi:hypothetical protein
LLEEETLKRKHGEYDGPCYLMVGMFETNGVVETRHVCSSVLCLFSNTFYGLPDEPAERPTILQIGGVPMTQKVWQQWSRVDQRGFSNHSLEFQD